MNNQYDEIALCAHVAQGQVEYYKEYSLNGRIVKTEQISCGEFVRLLCNGANKPLRRERKEN